MGYYLDAFWSPNKNAGDYAKVGFTIHHAATTDFGGVGRTFQSPARQASAHYGVEPGHVQQYVEDPYVAWHAGDSWANAHTIGIECVNSGGEAQGWPVAEGTVDTLVEFLADKCRELDIEGLSVGENLWGHKDFSATFCPGVLYPRLGEIADRVNAILNGEEDDMFTEDDRAMMADIKQKLYDDSDPTGRDKPGDIAFKVKWMAAKQEEMQADIDEIKAALKIGGTD